MDPAQLVALGAFALVALVVGITARRAGLLLARTREAEGFRGAIGDLARRADASLDGIAETIDLCRRGAVAPEEIRSDIAAAREAVERYLREARSLSAPHLARGAHEGFVKELERAGRALELVDHGCDVQAQAWRGETGGEAQTSVKRGYLNLIHARESMGRHAEEARARAAEASPARRLRRSAT